MKALIHITAISTTWFLCYLLGAFFMNTFDISQWHEGTRFSVVLFVGTFAVLITPIVWSGNDTR